jgi:hypothetical protein
LKSAIDLIDIYTDADAPPVTINSLFLVREQLTDALASHKSLGFEAYPIETAQVFADTAVAIDQICQGHAEEIR